MIHFSAQVALAQPESSKDNVQISVKDMLSVIHSETKIGNAYMYNDTSPTADVISKYPTRLVDQLVSNCAPVASTQSKVSNAYESTLSTLKVASSTSTHALAASYEHLFIFDHYLYFRPLSEKEGGFLSFRLATSDLLVLKMLGSLPKGM